MLKTSHSLIYSKRLMMNEEIFPIIQYFKMKIKTPRYWNRKAPWSVSQKHKVTFAVEFILAVENERTHTCISSKTRSDIRSMRNTVKYSANLNETRACDVYMVRNWVMSIVVYAPRVHTADHKYEWVRSHLYSYSYCRLYSMNLNLMAKEVSELDASSA